MKVLILCGGYGARLAGVGVDVPKPMVPIGGKPMAWHIMKGFAHWGFDDFVLCLGYRSDLFRQYFLNFPRELEEAGRVDGLSYFGAFWRIVVPNSLQFYAAIAVITFISSWNSFLWPLVVGQDPSSWTVQVVLSTFITAQTINVPELFMGVAVAIAPLVILFFFLQRYIVAGVARSGIKE